MILLIGGAAETADFAELIARAGFSVLVSTATEIPLRTGDHPNIRRRSGRLDLAQMVLLARTEGVTMIIDVSHPYATTARRNSMDAAQELGLPHFTWVRPPAALQNSGLLFARDHGHAAELAFGFQGPVLLTTGSRNLEPYAEQSRRTGLPLIVRVLPYEESLESCSRAGIPDERVVTGRGPFSIQQNLGTIDRFGIRCLVTKDSGTAGGFTEKIEAARMARCAVVVVQRPDRLPAKTFSSPSQLIEVLLGCRETVSEAGRDTAQFRETCTRFASDSRKSLDT